MSSVFTFSKQCDPCFRYLASGMSMKDAGRYFRIGTSTVSGIIPDVCTAIWDVLGPRELATPDKRRWLEISQEFGERWNFPRCLGELFHRPWVTVIMTSRMMQYTSVTVNDSSFSYSLCAQHTRPMSLLCAVMGMDLSCLPLCLCNILVSSHSLNYKIIKVIKIIK